MFPVNAQLGGAAAAPGGSGVTPSPVSWNNISGNAQDATASAATNVVTFASLSATISVQISWTGGATITPVRNGTAISPLGNGGSITIVNGDTLGFIASADFTTSGTVTVTNTWAPGTPVLGTFTYSLRVRTTGFK